MQRADGIRLLCSQTLFGCKEKNNLEGERTMWTDQGSNVVNTSKTRAGLGQLCPDGRRAWIGEIFKKKPSRAVQSAERANGHAYPVGINLFYFVYVVIFIFLS